MSGLLRLMNCVLVVHLMSGCTTCPSSGTPKDVESAILQNNDHMLLWAAYDGTGDPEGAIYSLDGQSIGKGKVGIDRLKHIISRMPQGSRVDVGHYYGGGAGEPKRKYPFDVRDLLEYCRQYGVIFRIQSAG